MLLGEIYFYINNNNNNNNNNSNLQWVSKNPAVETGRVEQQQPGDDICVFERFIFHTARSISAAI